MIRRCLPLLLALTLLPGLDGVAQESERPNALEQIQPTSIRSHLRFLSDDLLEGRETATRGYYLAAHYVAAQFEVLGLEPALPNGSYFQSVPLRKAEVIEEQTSMTLVGGERTKHLVYGDEYRIHPDLRHEQIQMTAPVVFVGFGVVAPELNYDDYAQVDVAGKIVAFLWGVPSSFSADQHGYYTMLKVKEETAIAHGARGMVVLLPAPKQTVARVVRQLDGFAWLDDAGEPHSLFFGLGWAAWLSAEGAEILFAGAPQSWQEVLTAAKAGETRSFELPVTAQVRITARHVREQSPNLAAILRGSDPTLREEYVVYSAHVDHVGIGEPVDGDAIYNGALDNAGGTAVLLAIARAFANLPQPPRRSILFLGTTAEEKGILGADYFVHSAPVSRDDIVANINLDNFLMLHPLKDIAPIGADYSTLMDTVALAASELGLDISPDPVPNQGIFGRSDHYPFMRSGVPAVFLFSGLKTGDGERNGTEMIESWLRTRHHSPNDSFDQPIDFAAGAKYAQMNFLIGYYVANDTGKPTWKAGPFFWQKER